MNDIFYWIFHIIFWIALFCFNDKEMPKLYQVGKYIQVACIGGQLMYILLVAFS